MSGYQSIPSASSSTDAVGSIENGAPPTLADHSPSPLELSSVPSRKTSLPVSPLASKIGYILFGAVVGFISSAGLLRWGAFVDNEKSSEPLLNSTPNNQQSFRINGKSFLDSLPFEEIFPSSWNHAKSRPDEEKLPLLSVSLLGSNVAPAPTASSGPHLLYHAHQSSFGLLYDSSKSSNYYLSEYSLDYFLINSGGHDAQINQAYCAVATVAAVLNSLKYAKRFRDGGDLSGWSFDLPIDPRYDPYPYATQQDILAGDCVWNTVVEHGDGSTDGEHGGNVDGIFKPPYGLSLEQSAKLLKCHTSEEWDVSVQNVDPSKITQSRMRYELKAALIDPDARVMINYDRKELGQVGGGHFSPVGAYHASTDSFLVVDVAKYKYPPVWVGTDTLFNSMATVDKCGTYDYPKGQERLADGTSSKYINPITPLEYAESLALLNCEKRMRGYIILKKK